MTDLLGGRLEVGRIRGTRPWRLCPRQKLLINSVPVSLPVRVGLEYPAYVPFPHRCLLPQTPPAARDKLLNRPDASVTEAVTNSAGADRSGSGRICHLRSDHLSQCTMIVAGCLLPAEAPVLGLRQDRRVRVPCFSVSHSPAPQSLRPVLSTSRCSGCVARAGVSALPAPLWPAGLRWCGRALGA
jgi:hypothetical protein